MWIEIVKATAVVLASLVALYGINSWRREGKWKRKFELSEQVLSTFYQCQEELRAIRSPAGSASEGNTRKKNPNEDPEDSKLLDNAHIVVERYNNRKEPFIKLRVLKFQFMALFGKEFQTQFNEVNIIVNSIMNASYFVFNPQNKYQRTDKDWERIQKYEKNLYYEENDELEQRMNAAVSVIEKVCRQAIEKNKFFL